MYVLSKARLRISEWRAGSFSASWSGSDVGDGDTDWQAAEDGWGESVVEEGCGDAGLSAAEDGSGDDGDASWSVIRSSSVADDGGLKRRSAGVGLILD